MKRITVDTNTLISASLWKGNESKIIELAQNKLVEIVLSEEILSEFEGVLKRKFYKMASPEKIQSFGLHPCFRKPV